MPRRIDKALDKVASCKISMSTRNAKRWLSLKNHLGFLTDDKLMDYLLDLADSIIVRDENANGNVESHVVRCEQEVDVQSRFVNDTRILHSNSQRHSTKESNIDDSSKSGKLDQKESKAHAKACLAKLAKTRRHKRKSKCHRDKHKKNKNQKIKDSCVSTCAGNKTNQSDSRRQSSDENFTNSNGTIELPSCENVENDFECDLGTSVATRRSHKKRRKSLQSIVEPPEWNQSCTLEDKEDAQSCEGLTETCDENSKQESEQDYSADETPVSGNDDENHTGIVESAIADVKAVDTDKDIETNTKSHEVAIDICKNREVEHFQDSACPFIESEHAVQDSITLDNWLIKHKRNSRLAQVNNSIDPMSKGYVTNSIPEPEQEIVQPGQDEMCSDLQREEEQENTHPDWPLFSRESLPMCLELKITNLDHGIGIFARNSVSVSTRFGPLVGTHVQEKDIPDDYSMKHIWEVSVENKTQYISTTNPLTSNWMRYLRPADTEDSKTVDVVKKNGQLFLVTCKALIAGTELLYWFDSQSKSWTRKNRMDKTNCGGCNLKFSHPIYYRLHCCIFHDTNYSLTIRKYHCKVCGAAVLGKDNIMKHAAQFHAGRGAYQCQYCKKFFLRLNYLEMHRTYGCSKNPSRSRPLCDFCGRKFCQPQKLKVHIKRMHSDASDVLEEFQCKSCSKLLGSRAALQRHMKEVHHKDVVGAAACDRCGKTFQNKSNLKIHMLTHSGVKPFKCRENECKAAFTTKQCLQFHYKKVHRLSDEMMPKIERSIAYTFDAYSGGLVEDLGRGKTPKFTGDEKEECMDDLELEDDSSRQSSHEAPIIESPPSLEKKTERAIKSKIDLVESSEESSGMKLDSIQVEYPIPETFDIDSIPNDKQSSDKSPSRISPNDEKQLELTCCKRQESYTASLLVEAALDAAERDIGVVSIPPLEDNEQGNTDFYSVPNELCFKSVDYQVAHEATIAGNVDSCFVPNSRQALSVSSQYRSTGYQVGTTNRLHSIEQYLEQEIPSSRYDDIVQFHSNNNSQIQSQSHPRSIIDSASSDESDSAVQNLSLAIKDKSIQQMESSRYNYDVDYDSVNKARVKFEPLIVQSAVAEQGLDMSARGIQQTCGSQLQNTNHLHHYHHHHHHHAYKMDENERQGVDLSISSPCVSSPSYATIYPPYPHVDVPRVVNLESSSHQLHTAVSRIIASPLPETSALIPSDCAPQIRILPSTASPIPTYNSTTWSLGTPHHTPRSGYHYCNYY